MTSTQQSPPNTPLSQLDAVLRYLLTLSPCFWQSREILLTAFSWFPRTCWLYRVQVEKNFALLFLCPARLSTEHNALRATWETSRGPSFYNYIVVSEETWKQSDLFLGHLVGGNAIDNSRGFGLPFPLSFSLSFSLPFLLLRWLESRNDTAVTLLRRA